MRTALLICISLAFFSCQSPPKIGFVRSSVLLEEFDGTKEAKLTLQNLVRTYQDKVDTLEFDFQRSLNRYREEGGIMPEKSRMAYRVQLEKQEKSLIRYKEEVDLKLQNEEAKLMDGVLKQINSFAEDYGKQNEFVMILGTTTSGNLLYAHESTDITQELLTALNDDYAGR